MDKLLAFTLLLGFMMVLHALQADEEIAMRALFQGKHAVNRAAHAAAQQVDLDQLKTGIVAIDSTAAKAAAALYLQRNLRLDAANEPLPGSFWRSRVEVVALEVINADQSFPYTYVHAGHDYEVTLQRPGVVMIIRLVYPRTYNVLGPIIWEIKGAAELVY